MLSVFIPCKLDERIQWRIRVCWWVLADTCKNYLFFYRVKGPKGDKISVFLYTLYLAGSFVFYLDSLCIVLGRRVSFFSWTGAQVAEKGREKATHGEREKQG